METLERMSGEDEAVHIINSVVEKDGGGGISTESLAQKIEREADERASLEAQGFVTEYIVGLQDNTRGATAEALDPGVGGLYNQEIVYAQNTLYVSESIDTTMAQIEAVSKHENYHAKNKHLEAMTPGQSASDRNIVVIAGEGFTETEIIEGLTVSETKSGLESTEYIAMADNLVVSVHEAGLTMGQVKEAVNEKKDLRPLDDASREKHPEETYALAG